MHGEIPWGIVFAYKGITKNNLNTRIDTAIKDTAVIDNLPPSAKLVFKILEYSGLLTQKEIVRESYLPARTVRYALNRLKKENILEERFYFKDARQSLYGIKAYFEIPENGIQGEEVLLHA